MSDRDARPAFEFAGAFLRGHFVYTSGRHGADYLEKFRILEDPRATTELAGMIAERFRAMKPELIAGPTTGGIILAFEVARQLGVDAVYVERGEPVGRVLRRGFAIHPETPALGGRRWGAPRRVAGRDAGLHRGRGRCRHRHWGARRPNRRPRSDGRALL